MLNVHDLVEFTGGKLSLARLPPLDGVCGAVPRVVLDSLLVERGDVFWCINPQSCDSQLAYLRGAIGVVSGRAIEPWPGTFSLLVDDAVAALGRLVDAVQALPATIPPDLESAALDAEFASGAALQKNSHEIEELKVLQLPAVLGIANFPHTCGQSAEGQVAPRCRRAA